MRPGHRQQPVGFPEHLGQLGIEMAFSSSCSCATTSARMIEFASAISAAVRPQDSIVERIDDRSQPVEITEQRQMHPRCSSRPPRRSWFAALLGLAVQRPSASRITATSISSPRIAAGTGISQPEAAERDGDRRRVQSHDAALDGDIPGSPCDHDRLADPIEPVGENDYIRRFR